MSETQTKTVDEINAATDASLASHTAPAVETAKPKTANRTAKAAAPEPAKAEPAAKTPRKALTPKERAAKPVTANIEAYVSWLDKTVFDGKMSAAQKSAAGI
jgi:hypothetical protein